MRRSNVEFYLNRNAACSPLEVLFDDGFHHQVLRMLMAFAAEDRFGLAGDEIDDRAWAS